MRRKLILLVAGACILGIGGLAASRQGKTIREDRFSQFRLDTSAKRVFGVRESWETTYRLFEGDKLRWLITMPNDDWDHWLDQGTVYALSHNVPGPGGGGRLWARDLFAREVFNVGLADLLGTGDGVLREAEEDQQRSHRNMSVWSGKPVLGGQASLQPERASFQHTRNGLTQFCLPLTNKSTIFVIPWVGEADQSQFGGSVTLIRQVASGSTDPIGKAFSSGKAVNLSRLQSDLPGTLFSLEVDGDRQIVFCRTQRSYDSNALIIRSQELVDQVPTKVVRTPGHRVLWFDVNQNGYPYTSVLRVLDASGSEIGKVDLRSTVNPAPDLPQLGVNVDRIFLRLKKQDVPLTEIPPNLFLADEEIVLLDSAGGRVSIHLTGEGGKTKMSTSYNPVPGERFPPRQGETGARLDAKYRSSDGKLSASFRPWQGGALLTMYGKSNDADGNPVDVELKSLPIPKLPESAIISNSGYVWFICSYGANELRAGSPSAVYLQFANMLGDSSSFSFDLSGKEWAGSFAMARNVDLSHAVIAYSKETKLAKVKNYPITRFAWQTVAIPGLTGRARIIKIVDNLLLPGSTIPVFMFGS